MLPAGNRLRRREDFATAVRRGRRAGRPSLVLHLSLAAPVESGDGGRSTGVSEAASEVMDPHGAVESPPPPRAGFVVSKAVGNAVVRNRVKRRLRHLVAARVDRLPEGSLVVVRALPASAAADHTALGRDLDAALDRLLNPPPERGGRSRPGTGARA
jgi:ribonuclease P protein component